MLDETMCENRILFNICLVLVIYVNRKSIVQLVASVLMLIALLYGRSVSYPDNVHSLHGLPLVWGTHQLVTIAGPVDYWMVSITNLAIDLVIWLAIIMIIPYLLKDAK
jgi:hypothetical protein